MFKKSLLSEKTTIRVGEGRLSYPHLFTPVGSTLNPEPKYSLEFLIPKSDVGTIAIIKEAIKNATEKGLQKYWLNKKPAKFNDDLIKDGDDNYTKDGAPIKETEGCWIIRANCSKDHKPGVYDDSQGLGRVALTENDTDKIYGGCYGWLIGNVVAYDTPAQKGVKIYLANFVKSRDGEPFGGSAKALANAMTDDDDNNEIDDLPF